MTTDNSEQPPNNAASSTDPALRAAATALDVARLMAGDLIFVAGLVQPASHQEMVVLRSAVERARRVLGWEPAGWR